MMVGKILIVDDNYENLQVLGMHLQEAGYDIEFSTSGKTALEWLENEEFDIALLDINMPGMSGFELCSKIRKNNKLKRLPIIFLSADDQRENILKGLSIGGQDYISKPFDSRELIARVNTHITLKKKIDALATLSQTLEKKVEERTIQLKIAKERAEKSDSMKHAFLSNFSHEIRTPLTGIVSTAELLVSEQLSDDDKNFCVESIKKSSFKLVNTISSVLEMSQLLSGSIIANFAKTDIAKILKEVYEEFIDLFKNKNISLNIEINDIINEIITDRNILKIILTKLVDNALKFTESDGQVSIGIKPLAEQIEIFVSDTGIGMDDETIKNVFTTFFRNDPSSRNKEGVGLGLALAQNFCKLLNGEIHITSSPDKGTYIGITLPFQQPNHNN